jgi:hypothetical protein
MLNQKWNGILYCEKTLPQNPPEADVKKMIHKLRNKDVSIDFRLHQVGNMEGLSLLDEMRKQTEMSSYFVDEMVLLRAACLDDWSQQLEKDEQDNTRTSRNVLAHGGNIRSDIETIKRYLWDVNRSKRWISVFQNLCRMNALYLMYQSTFLSANTLTTTICILMAVGHPNESIRRLGAASNHFH